MQCLINDLDFDFTYQKILNENDALGHSWGMVSKGGGSKSPDLMLFSTLVLSCFFFKFYFSITEYQCTKIIFFTNILHFFYNISLKITKNYQKFVARNNVIHKLEMIVGYQMIVKRLKILQY